MAGDWIKVECTTVDKPEVHAISQILGLNPDETLGKLIRIWAWADSNISDGCVKRFCNANVTPESIIDHVCGVTGFAEAMISVGWLERKNDSISFPNFDRHNGNPAKKRAETNRRVKRFRNADSVTDALPEKRRDRVSKNTKKYSYSEDFERFWSAFPPKRRKDKQEASKVFENVISVADGPCSATLIEAAKRYAESPEGKGEYVKGPAPWLNKGCWDDAPESWGLAGNESSKVFKKEPYSLPARVTA